MKKVEVLFLIHDLGQGGAEKVLVNLANHLDQNRYDVTVHALFGGGVNRQFLKDHVHYKESFAKAIPGNSKLMLLFSPQTLYKWLIKDRYDIAVSYLEGPSARIIAGCPYEDSKKVSWIHSTQKNEQIAAAPFRSYQEAAACYGSFDRHVCVSRDVREDFQRLFPSVRMIEVLYNANDTDKIAVMKAYESPVKVDSNKFNIALIGKLEKNKGFNRIITIAKHLKAVGYIFCINILGIGSQRKVLEEQISSEGVEDVVKLLGYQENPYAVIDQCDLYVCSSHAEGFSTAATEALILGLPVVATRVGGMEEMLGENQYGVIVDNDQELADEIEKMMTDSDYYHHYREMSQQRSAKFSIKETVGAVEEMFENLLGTV